MKAFLIGLSLILLGCASTQPYATVESITETRSKIVFETSSFEVDNLLLPYVKEYVQTAYSYDIDLDSLSRKYSGIYVDYPVTGLWGETLTPEAAELLGIERYSLVHPVVIFSHNKTRYLVFHELSHVFLGRSHCHTRCIEIFSATVLMFGVYGKWEEQKQTLFENRFHLNFARLQAEQIEL